MVQLISKNDQTTMKFRTFDVVHDGKIVGELRYNHTGRRWIATLSVNPKNEFRGAGLP